MRPATQPLDNSVGRSGLDDFDAFSLRDASLALAIGRQAAVAIEHARLHERARRAAALEERQRLARELHDSVTQGLYGISLYAAAARRAMYVRRSLMNVDGSSAIEIEDDGVGFQPDAAPGGFGLAGMRERAVRLGGSLQVTSAPGAGARVRIEILA
jgi:signal transduction histidine kinase